MPAHKGGVLVCVDNETVHRHTAAYPPATSGQPPVYCCMLYTAYYRLQTTVTVQGYLYAAGLYTPTVSREQRAISLKQTREA